MYRSSFICGVNETKVVVYTNVSPSPSRSQIKAGFHNRSTERQSENFSSKFSWYISINFANLSLCLPIFSNLSPNCSTSTIFFQFIPLFFIFALFLPHLTVSLLPTIPLPFWLLFSHYSTLYRYNSSNPSFPFFYSSSPPLPQSYFLSHLAIPTLPLPL